MLKLKVTRITEPFGVDGHATDDRIYIDGVGSGERFCEVLGTVGVDRTMRAKMIVNAIETYINHIRPYTRRSRIDGFPQLQFTFPEEAQL